MRLEDGIAYGDSRSCGILQGAVELCFEGQFAAHGFVFCYLETAAGNGVIIYISAAPFVVGGIRKANINTIHIVGGGTLCKIARMNHVGEAFGSVILKKNRKPEIIGLHVMTYNISRMTFVGVAQTVICRRFRAGYGARLPIDFC